ncbi:MAG: hypothetical protein ACRES5_30390 [Pseudomonas sp.]
MPVEGFRSEWFTVGKHRVHLEARASFPDEEHKFIATVAARTLDHHSIHARLVSVFFDDKACVYSVHVATTEEADKVLEQRITEILHSIFDSGNYFCDVTVVAKGDESSDHYHHMEHLSVAAGIATDRWAKGQK